MALDREGIALTLLAAAESAHSFSSFLPSSFTVRSFALDGVNTRQKLADLRSGYKPAVGLSIALGGIVSVLAKSAWPVLASTTVSLGMITLYERSIPKRLRKGPLAALLCDTKAVGDGGSGTPDNGTPAGYTPWYVSRALENY